MATLPDGNTVTLQITEPWGSSPPSNLTLQLTEPWGSSPPPIRGIGANGPTEALESGESATISGDVTDGSSNAVNSESITVTVTYPDGSETKLSDTTDSNGNYSVTTSALQQNGEYTATAKVNGVSKRITEGWE
jgi:hypothetical protein